MSGTESPRCLVFTLVSRISDHTIVGKRRRVKEKMELTFAQAACNGVLQPFTAIREGRGNCNQSTAREVSSFNCSCVSPSLSFFLTPSLSSDLNSTAQLEELKTNASTSSKVGYICFCPSLMKRLLLSSKGQTGHEMQTECCSGSGHSPIKWFEENTDRKVILTNGYVL